MERLTERIERYIEAYQLPPFGREVDGTVELLQEILKKLAHYEDAEKQGLLLRLPCKVGDTVYAIGFNNNRPFVYEAIILSILLIGKEIVFNVKVYEFKINLQLKNSMFGRTVFLTQAEAEQKLKEMESDSNDD